MGKIEDLKQKMYTPAFLGRRRKIFSSPEPTFKQSDRWGDEGPREKEVSRKKSHYTSIILGVLLGAGLLFFLGYVSIQSGFLFYFLGRSEVDVKIFSDSSVIAGQKVTYTVSYKNKSRKPITNVEIFFQYPKGSIPDQSDGFDTKTSGSHITLPDVPAGLEGTTQFRARIFGKEGDTVTARAVFLYRPENLNSKFTVQSDQPVQIARVPIAVTFSGGGKVRSGEPYEFDVEYASNADADFNDMFARVAYPQGFQFKESSIVPELNDSLGGYWSLGTIRPGTSGSIHVRGVLGGSPLEPKTFQYGLGAYDKDTHEWLPYVERTALAEVVAPPLFVQAIFDDPKNLGVSFGDTVSLKISYKNNFNIPIRNAVITATLDGPVDFSSLNPGQGTIVGSRGVIWNASGEQRLSLLQVGDSGELHLSFRVKPSSDITTQSLKNSSVAVAMTINADKSKLADVDLGSSNVLTLPINAIPALQAKLLYTGPLIQNSGPIPPKVGQKTSYTVVLELGTAGNDLTDVKIKAILPPYANWEGVVVPSDENISYQSGTGEVLWNAGDIVSSKNGQEGRKVYFQISFTPSDNQANSQPSLVTKIAGTAIDAFTNKEIDISARDVTTNLIDDFGVPVGSGTVTK